MNCWRPDNLWHTACFHLSLSCFLLLSPLVPFLFTSHSHSQLLHSHCCPYLFLLHITFCPRLIQCYSDELQYMVNIVASHQKCCLTTCNLIFVCILVTDISNFPISHSINIPLTCPSHLPRITIKRPKVDLNPGPKICTEAYAISSLTKVIVIVTDEAWHKGRRHHRITWVSASLAFPTLWLQPCCQHRILWLNIYLIYYS